MLRVYSRCSFNVTACFLQWWLPLLPRISIIRHFSIISTDGDGRALRARHIACENASDVNGTYATRVTSTAARIVMVYRCYRQFTIRNIFLVTNVVENFFHQKIFSSKYIYYRFIFINTIFIFIYFISYII